jgi:opacity protein-like surface antigen
MKTFYVSTVVAALMTAAAAQEAVNPVMEKFADHISLYVNFDDETVNPALAGGEKTLKAPPRNPGFAPGLFGKALRLGSASYHCPGNIDFSKPGTLIYWMAPAGEWPVEGKYPYLFPFVAFPGDSKIVMGRQAGDYGKTRIYLNVETPERKDWVGNGIAGGSGRDWAKDSWHMIVFSWTPESTGISVDGKPVNEVALKRPLAKGEGEWFAFTTQLKDDSVHQVMIDEITVLNRKLSDEEVKSLYDETLKRVKK